ncbi:MAG: 1,3-beta-galactosyl-N-acetylhexosamine phosphorylase [Bacilli bacterium]|nr:1,3-beta-galactosyl-N-acetylhexosamine phosphorylase [Bacilli bacterium]
MSHGRVTIPTDDTFVEETKQIAKLWGADAIRDCDGVELPKNPKDIAKKVYKTYFVVRGDNEWGRKHREEAHRIFLESNRVTSMTSKISIDVMNGYLQDQIAPDLDNLDRWQVFDRTTGKEIKKWNIDNHNVVFECEPFHEYSVDFMARMTWHPVQIYNYLTNNWTCEKQLCYDPAYPNTRKYIKEYLQKWLDENPDINVVRFTTFLYNFGLVFNNEGKERMVDWFGYHETASVPLLEMFEKETGIHLVAEDFIDDGCYNSPFRLPRENYKKYMRFVMKFVSSTMKELVDIVHKNGREAMMFLGDDWIGSEPYGEYFKEIGLDSVVGSVGGGVTVRMLAEIPHVKIHEGRFLPYFFPDTFFPGNEDNAVAELNKNWNTARRALLRCPLDRMGFGGYLSLAVKYPKFVSRVTEICEEFRNIYDVCEGAKPYAKAKVAILNAWGDLRSWQSHMVAHELWYQQIYSYQGILEILSGLPVDVSFISFDDIINKGINKDIDVIINVGDEQTAFSGGEFWNNEKLISTIRKWVSDGHGFIGVGQPTSCIKGSRTFALSDVLGVDQEKGFTLSQDKYNITKKSNFITNGLSFPIDYGEGMKNIYALENADVLDIIISDRFKRNVNVGEVMLASNNYYNGRGVYIAGLPYSRQNARLLYKAILYACKKETELEKAYCSNINVECNYYSNKNTYVIINNSNSKETTFFYDINGNKTDINLAPLETKWIKCE